MARILVTRGARGMEFPWRWTSGTISTNLDVIWGMSAITPLRGICEMADLIRNRAQDWLKHRHGSIPYHSVLIAVYVCLSLYAANQDELFFDSVLAAIVIAITTAAIIVLLFWVAIGNGRAAGVVSTLIIVCLAYYGHVFDAIDDLMGGSAQDKIFMPIWVGLFLVPVVVSFIFRSRLENVTRLLNFSALVLVLVPLGSLIWKAAGENRSAIVGAAPNIFDQMPLSSSAPNATEYPDIYYLIFDRYADSRTLNDIYKYDNNEVLEHLGGLGFYIADRSRANYTKTAHSLVSSLNLRHLTYLSELIGPGSSDWKPLYALLQDHEVGRFLKAHGYRYVHLGSWWGPTRSNVLADENFDATTTFLWMDVSLNEFEWLLVEPMLPTRFMSLAFNLKYDTPRQQFVRVQEKFKKLVSLQRQAEPLFVFSHMLLPHEPFVFFPDGRYKPGVEAASLTRHKNYIDQLEYTNRKIKELVRELLKKEPQPIIVIQSDEGPFPIRYSANNNNLDWREASMEELRQKFGILNAIYFPDRGYNDLYEDLTPINTFRIIFNRYFGQNLPLLPDTSYSHYSRDDLYSFFDVTEVTK